MKDVKIDTIFAKENIEVTLAILCYEVKVTKSKEELIKELEELTKIILKEKEDYRKEERKQNDIAYKKLGKDPKRYPNSANALIKRVIKGKDLYHINNVVDVNNYISLLYGYSLGSYDMEKLKGSILLRKATDEDCYKGIGKEEIHLENLPVLEDEIGIFGSPTSDSTRAMTLENTKKVMTVIYTFSKNNNIKEVVEKTKIYLEKYADITNLKEKIITNENHTFQKM